MSTRYVDLTTRMDEMEAQYIAGILNDAGIDWDVRPAESALYGIFAHASSFPHTVQVRDVDFDRASNALSQSRKDSVDIDWDEVDLGKPENELASRFSGIGKSAWKRRSVVPFVLMIIFVFAPPPILGIMEVDIGFITWSVVWLVLVFALVYPVVLNRRAARG